MVLTPPAWACWGEWKSTSRPSRVIRPASRRYAPVRILIRVDLPAPFWPMTACTSPRPTASEAPSRARTPGKALLIPSIWRSGAGALIGSVGGGDVLLGVGRVEELVGVDDLGGDRLPARVCRGGLGRLGPEPRVALDAGAELAVHDRLQGRPLAVDRDQGHVLARLAPGRLEGGDGADGHLVVVGVDGVHVGVGPQQGLHHLAALVAVEIAVLGGQDLHARLALNGVLEALAAVVGRRGPGGPEQLDDVGLAAGLLDQPLGRPLALLDEVRADEGDVVLARLGQALVDVAVEQEHRDAGLHVGDLLGRRPGGVGVDELPAALGGLLLDAGRLGEPPGVVLLGLRKAD